MTLKRFLERYQEYRGGAQRCVGRMILSVREGSEKWLKPLVYHDAREAEACRIGLQTVQT